jgi:hypothetical protein
MGACVTAAVLLGAACGSDPTTSGPPSTTGSADGADTGDTSDGGDTSDDTNGDESGRGWIDGEPDWGGGGGALAYGDEAAATDGEAVTVVASGGDRDASDAVPVPDDGIPAETGPLKAGSVDDNADYPGFLSYLTRIGENGVMLREASFDGRTIVTVRHADGRPAAGVEVIATLAPAGEPFDPVPIPLRTTADGTARLLPQLDGDVPPGHVVTFRVGDVTASTAQGTDVTLTLAASAPVPDPVPLDVLFLLDATGSMGDEIDRLKTTIDAVAERVAALEPAPDVRFAMTLYRDEGDAFVTSTFDFTGDVAEFRSALADVVADGGGDYPEALEEGLAEALGAPSWRDPAAAVQLVFLVADAPPQVTRQVDSTYVDSMRVAAERGIKIFPVASSESDDQAEAVFRQLAMATGAPFVFLSYGAGGAATGGSTDIATTDYEELALDELVVRLIAEELADLAGPDVPPVTVPTTIPPTTTVPDGQ